MINLLPPDTKEALHYARRNLVLRKWIIASLLCILGSVLLLVGGSLYLDQSIKETSKQVADTQKQLAKARVPEGWKLVPIIQSFAMWEDMHDVLVMFCVDGKTVTEAWNAALAAAPTKPE